MSKSFSIFVRVIGVLLAALDVAAAFLTRGTGPLAVILYLVSAIILLTFAFQYAKHIDTTLEHENGLMTLTTRVKQLEDMQQRLESALQRLEAAPQTEPLSQNKTQTPKPAPSADISEFLANVRAELRPAAEGAVRPVPVPDDPGYFVCPCCGKIQKGRRSNCWNCGAAFLVE